MQALFEVASGSVIGRDHLRLGKNNQDAHYIFSSEQVTIAIVCDGCGSSEHSEVGAKIGARLTASAIQSTLSNTNGEINSDFWMSVTKDLLIDLYVVARTMTMESSLIEVIHDYFLFTIVGTVITPTETCIFSVGDGVLAVGDCITVIDKFPNNAPPYIAYGVEAMLESQQENQHRLNSFTFSSTSLMPEFFIHAQLPTPEVQSILIGSDGVSELIQSQDQFMPGKQEYVGAIAQFWQEDRYFSNPDMIRRRLTLINREITKFDSGSKSLVKEMGLLPDDTTIITIRKRK